MTEDVSEDEAVPMSGGDHRSLPVPESLAGERVDAAIAQLFGLSRTCLLYTSDAADE